MSRALPNTVDFKETNFLQKIEAAVKHLFWDGLAGLIS